MRFTKLVPGGGGEQVVTKLEKFTPNSLKRFVLMFAKSCEKSSQTILFTKCYRDSCRGVKKLVLLRVGETFDLSQRKMIRPLLKPDREWRFSWFSGSFG